MLIDRMRENCSRPVWLSVIAGFFVTFSAFSGTVYYVGPEGDDAASGSRDAPWATLENAGEAAEAGDTVVFLPGDYAGVLAPVNSGTADAPLVFRAEQRRTARLLGEDSSAYPLDLDGVAHVRIEGFHIEPGWREGRWLRMDQCEHVVIRDCLMEKGFSGMPFHITNSKNIWVQDSVLRKNAFNMARISDSENIVFEGNVVSRAGHSPFQIFPPDSNRRMVVRGNVFHAAWGRPFEFFTTDDVLFEHNIITHAYNSGRSASSNAKFCVQRGIFRFNRVFRNPGGPLHLYPWREGMLEALRFYNNVFHDCAHYGFRIRGGDQVRDVQFMNNILAHNDPHGNSYQMRASGGGPVELRFRGNALRGPEPGWGSVIDWNGSAYSVEAANEAAPDVFEGNVDADPGFVDAANYIHGLRADSALRNAAMPLARAVGDGEAAVLPVDDVLPFYDGFGIPGEAGDVIRVGADAVEARVVEVNRGDQTLVLDQSVRWQDGDPVNLRWSGSGPDVGVYEHGEDGRPSVEVRAEPFHVAPGEPVQLRLVLRGIADTASIEWQLGDGTLVLDTTEFTHTYDRAYDYPIRVRVEDTNGGVHRGTGYVVVEPPRDPGAPLLHSTFGIDDDEWWWRWQSYRPATTAARRWERVLVLEDGTDVPPPWTHPRGGNRIIAPGEEGEHGEGWLRVYAPEDGGLLPAWVHPADWCIDTYPLLRIRYRVDPGTPIGFYIRAFSGQELWLAASPNTSRAENDPDLPRLEDDGEWHILDTDVRVIRDRYPGVNVLEGLRFLAPDRGRVKEGHSYCLDEVLIAPEGS